MIIYTTQEWKGNGKQNYYCYQYKLKGDEVIKYLCHRQKLFDGKENYWNEEETAVDSWAVDDESMPEWLKGYVADAI